MKKLSCTYFVFCVFLNADCMDDPRNNYRGKNYSIDSWRLENEAYCAEVKRGDDVGPRPTPQHYYSNVVAARVNRDTLWELFTPAHQG
jgi:hypothetical protein